MLISGALGGLLLLCNCERQTPELAEQPLELQGLEGGFFDDALLLEGAIDIAKEEAEVVCAGKGSVEIRGVVFAPQGQLALAPKWPFPAWLVGSAAASALEGELGVGEVAVRLYERADALLAQTTTSRSGRFCLLVDALGPTTVVEAGSGGVRLRRLVLNADDADVHAVSEAFLQTLLEREVALDKVARATLVNLEVVGQTAVDLLNPVVLEDGEGVAAGVERAKRALEGDARFGAMIERLARR